MMCSIFTHWCRSHVSLKLKLRPPACPSTAWFWNSPSFFFLLLANCHFSVSVSFLRRQKWRAYVRNTWEKDFPRTLKIKVPIPFPFPFRRCICWRLHLSRCLAYLLSVWKLESPLPRPLLIRPPNPKLPHLPTRNVRLQVDRQVKLSCEVSVKL